MDGRPNHYAQGLSQTRLPAISLAPDCRPGQLLIGGMVSNGPSQHL